MKREVFAAYHFILGKFLRSAVFQQFSLKKQVSAVSNAQGFVHVVGSLTVNS